MPTWGVLLDVIGDAFDPAVQAECQAETGGIESRDHLIDVPAFISHQMENWPEHLAVEPFQPVDLVQRRCDVCPGTARLRHREVDDFAPLSLHQTLVAFEIVLRRFVDHGSDIRSVVERIADIERLNGPSQHRANTRRIIV